MFIHNNIVIPEAYREICKNAFLRLVRAKMNLRFAGLERIGGSLLSHCGECTYHTGRYMNPVNCTHERLRKIYDEYCDENDFTPEAKEAEWEYFSTLAAIQVCDCFCNGPR